MTGHHSVISDATCTRVLLSRSNGVCLCECTCVCVCMHMCVCTCVYACVCVRRVGWLVNMFVYTKSVPGLHILLTACTDCSMYLTCYNIGVHSSVFYVESYNWIIDDKNFSYEAGA